MSAPTGDQSRGTSSRLSVEPFPVVRYADRDSLARRTSPAYDLVDAEERALLERADPHNVVRLILPRASPDQPTAPRYARAAETLGAWRANGVLTTDPTPALLVYEMSSDAGRTRGVLGTIPVLDPVAGGVLPHESTAEPVVADRLALVRATEANLEPVVVAYEPAADAPPIATETEPTFTMRSDDGVLHRVWRISETERIHEIQEAIHGRGAVIADGHHRYASYLAYRQLRHATDGDGPWDRALAYLVPTTGDGLRVQAIHRVVLGLDLATAARRAAAAFRVRELDVPPADLAHVVASMPSGTLVLTDGTSSYLIDQAAAEARHLAAGSGRAQAWRRLDVVLAHRLLIETLWETAPDSRWVTVSAEVARAVDLARQGGVAVLLRAPEAADVLEVARSGELMPQKSTLFVPKPRTGIVLRCYADER